MNPELATGVRPADRIELRTAVAAPPRAYRVAGAGLITNAYIPALDAFVAASPAGWQEPDDDRRREPTGRIIYDGPGWIDNRWRHVISRDSAGGYHLSIDDVSYWIRSDGGLVVEYEGSAPGSIALGAPLILALALRATFGLHAGVVAAGEELIAFVGESGAGKSTLARYLDEHGPPWRRIIDDTLPVRRDEAGGFVALPHLPQPKIPSALQPAALAPERMSLRVIYLLDEAGEPAGGVDIRPLSPAEAAVTLVQHTVGGRLFARDLLSAHLGFCAGMAQAIPVKRLSYPRRFDVLPDVAARLAAGLNERSR